MPSEVLKALSDSTRIKVVQALEGTEICACEFVNITGRAQPTVSQHLSVLENGGVVKPRQDDDSHTRRGWKCQDIWTAAIRGRDTEPAQVNI